ncbi:hypothetical protein BOTBODRAFT_36924 [Botryobasidium botryosum FD-172 SS1]|uniref:PIG-F-domain-containing protein n=1 Tax=Botryobasidium botryosum (strain FD-172 SS1) TaxID=930990 RepID=A0A067MC98_BOTB1|nr:hypothetical protein BOTBODRAFT_36924 [Botryobasidium botryosum FD-172 SS1]
MSSKPTRRQAASDRGPSASQASTSSDSYQSQKGATDNIASPELPLLRYASLLGTHTVLLLFSVFYLPRTTLLPGSSPYASAYTSGSSYADPRTRQHPLLAPLTASPERTLGWACAGAAVLAGWWGGYMRIWVAGGKIGSKKENDKVGKTDENARKAKLVGEKFKVMGAAWAATLVGTFAFHAFIVLFGAPLTTHVLRTFLLSLLLSILTIYTAAYSLPLETRLRSFSLDRAPTSVWTKLFSEFSAGTSTERALVYPVLGTLIGCWLGAFALPLDWERPWQTWPLTPAFGAIAGHILGSVVSLVISGTLYLASLDQQQQTQSKVE